MPLGPGSDDLNWKSSLPLLNSYHICFSNLLLVNDTHCLDEYTHCLDAIAYQSQRDCLAVHSLKH